MRKIIYLICVFVSICILSGCGSKSVTINRDGQWSHSFLLPGYTG